MSYLCPAFYATKRSPVSLGFSFGSSIIYSMKSEQNLVIVESPAKAKTISKFLGKEFTVLSSYGHIRDLKSKSFSVDVDNHFAPDYAIPEDKMDLVAQLKEAAGKSDVVWLASDEDREGEAISWHLYEILERAGKPTHRIVFHEITEQAIKNAIAHPRQIDYNLVNAQQARRILDRIVGFELSPVLWRRVRPSLSAGRVQSVAVRLVVDREREIQAFVPEAKFRIQALFRNSEGSLFTAECSTECTREEEAVELVRRIAGTSFIVTDVQKKPGKRSPAAPFTTSTLQQEAARKLGYSVSNTMRLAQKLYENGFITYMRTDSVALSSLALGTAADTIRSQWGDEYYKYRTYKTHSKGAQEAHEAIRPTFIAHTEIKGTAQEQALYDLIRKRTLATQMADARIERTVISIEGQDQLGTIAFVASGEVIVFDGFMKVYNESREDEEEGGAKNLLPLLARGVALHTVEAMAEERFSRPPARYSEASLVRKMEELGIGRPSTYAPTIQTIQNREYVKRGDNRGQKRTVTSIEWKDEVGYNAIPVLNRKTENFGNEKGKLLPTDMGLVVNDFLVENFPDVVDYNFTAMVEEQFDQVAEGELQWQQMLQLFYDKFHPTVEDSLNAQTKHYNGERILGVDPQSGKQVSVRIGRFGPMAQLGIAEERAEGADKPLFASIPGTLSIATITLEEALKLFELPRTVGLFEEREVVASTGRFGPFVKHGSLFASIPKHLDPITITIEEAIELIEQKREKDRASLLKQFDEDPDLSIRTGRFGPYIHKGKSNIKLVGSNKEHPEALTYEQCLQLIEEAAKTSKGAKKDKKTPTKRKTTVQAGEKKSSSRTTKKTKSTAKA